jgi:hypothetical protein
MEKRNSKCEGEEETNLQLESGSEKKLNEPPSHSLYDFLVQDFA